MQLKNKIPLSNINDRKIRKVIKKATEKKQGTRYQSASEFRVALDHIPERSGNNPVSFIWDKNIVFILIIAMAGLVVGGLIALLTNLL